MGLVSRTRITRTVTLIVRPSAVEDAFDLAPRLRQADRAEIMAAGGAEPLFALQRGFEASEDPMTVVLAGRPIAMFGVITIGWFENGWRDGSPWLLGSDEVQTNYFEFARRSREEFERVRAPWARLTNWIDDRNTLHKRWLRWLGFEFVELDPTYGVGRLPFWRFELCVSR